MKEKRRTATISFEIPAQRSIYINRNEGISFYFRRLQGHTAKPLLQQEHTARVL